MNRHPLRLLPLFILLAAIVLTALAMGCACETLTQSEWRTLEADLREHADDLETVLVDEPDQYLPDASLPPAENERRVSRLAAIAAAARALAEEVRQANPYTRDALDAPPSGEE